MLNTMPSHDHAGDIIGRLMLARLQSNDATIVANDRVLRAVPVTRRCAYKKWSPALARTCECWQCQLQREGL